MKLFKGLWVLVALHLFACTPYLSYDGQSEYVIVIDEKADSVQEKAAAELQHYLNEITGVKMPIRIEKGKKNIILTQELPASKTFTDFKLSTLQEDGFYLKTDQSDIYIIGGSEKGVLYGVYELLEQMGCRQYADQVQLIPDVDRLKLPHLDDVQVPAITYRDVLYTHAKTEPFRSWHRLDVPLQGEQRTEWGYWCHSFFDLVDPEIYFDKHPEYFAQVNGVRIPSTQLCTTNPDVIQIVVQRLKEEMALQPEAVYWSVSQEDTYGWCQCDKCKAINDKEETPMGAILHMVNQVADSFPDKVISTLAYEYSRKQPKHMKPRSNVNIMLCSIECNRSMPIESDPSSADFKDEVIAWSRISDNILVWDYVIQFKHLVSPFPNFHVLQPNLQFFANHGGVGEFQQGNREIGGEFAELRAYIIAKLLWNPDADVQALMSDFISGYYGDAGVYIQQYIEMMTEALLASGDRLDIFGNPVVASNSYLSHELLCKYEQLFDQAERAVMDDKALLERVKICRLPIQYARLEQAKADPFGPQGWFINENGHWKRSANLLHMLDNFRDVANKQGVSRVHEWDTTIDEYHAETMAFIDVDPSENKAFQAKVQGPPPNEKYAHTGVMELTNGISGTNDWNHHWIGYQGQDLEFVMTLDQKEMIELVETSFIQDAGSWIFHPKLVQVFVSNDGESFSPFDQVVIDQERDAPKVKTVSLKGKAEARYIKLIVKSQKQCPDWHIGVGNPAWTFIDEIVVK